MGGGGGRGGVGWHHTGLSQCAYWQTNSKEGQKSSKGGGGG